MRHLDMVRSGSYPKPSEFFRVAECSAIEIRKLLKSQGTQQGACVTSGSTDDAVGLAELIEELSRHGQTLPAAEAIDLVGRLERLFGQLQAEVDSLLAS